MGIIYAEDEPVGSIDLWGLQRQVIVHDVFIGRDGQAQIMSIEIYERLEENASMPYTYSELPRMRGKLEVYRIWSYQGTSLTPFLPAQAGTEELNVVEVQKWDPELTFSERSNEKNGGIEFFLSFGQGLEERHSLNAEVGESLDDLFAAFGAAKATGGIPPKGIDGHLRYLINSIKISSSENAKKKESAQRSNEEAVDSVCIYCKKDPHGLAYDRRNSLGEVIDTVYPNKENRNEKQ